MAARSKEIAARSLADVGVDAAGRSVPAAATTRLLGASPTAAA